MARNNNATAAQQELVLEIDRVFDAPRALIWRLWREPEHMMRWHGPEGLALTHCEIDFRVGGKWRRCMNSGTGYEHWISGEYLEIEEPSRLSFTYVNDADGFETVVTLRFLDEGVQTRMLFVQTPFISVAERDGHCGGWSSSFDLFAGYLALFNDDEWSPKGPPRRDGVAEDIIAARQRHAREKAAQEERDADPAKDR